MNEVKILCELEHPCIPKFNSFYQFDKKFHIVTEFVDSETLYDLILREDRIIEEEAAEIIQSLLEVLIYLEEKKIIHRDIKLENILVFYDLDHIKIKLTDFGCAINSDKITAATSFGTPGYVAPEILKGDKYDTKADIFSAGIVLYTLYIL